MESLRGFIQLVMFKNDKNESKKIMEDFIPLLKRMQSESVMFSEFCEVLQTPRPEMIDLLAAMQPQPFYLDPETSRVTFRSPVVGQVVKDYITPRVGSSKLVKVFKYLLN